MKKSPSVKGRNNLTKPAVSCTWFLIPKWTRFWTAWKKTGFDLLALVRRMLATILEWLKTYGKPQSLPQGAYNTDIIVRRMAECQTENQSAFIWLARAVPWTTSAQIYCHGLGIPAGLGLSVFIIWWSSNYRAQCSLAGPPVARAYFNFGFLKERNEANVSTKRFTIYYKKPK